MLSAARTIAILLALFASVMFAGLMVAPEPVRAASAPGQFDAPLSRERLERILGDGAPHPVDSAAEDVVRDNLLREITGLGFKPEVRDEFACRPQPRGPLVDCARVRNIIFSVGPANGPAVLAAAHYDSVPAAPGASDDGIGISVWLEVARLISRERLTRRVIFLFSDGEEPGLLGAYAFGRGDPLMASVESLVNLEARGSRGPAVFFESNQPNADAAAAFSAAPRPIANSVMADVYALLSNSTDVTALTRDNLDVINIAVLDGLEDYHTPHDTIASQDLRSVQHMGDVALAVTRRLAKAPDANVTTPMVYTDIASRVFVYAPSWAGQAALALCLLVALFAFWRAGPEGRWRALAAPPLLILTGGALAFAAGTALSALRPGEDYAFAHPEPTRAWCVLLAIPGAVLTAMVLRTGRNAEQTGAAAMLWFALIGGVASIFLSGISILYALPALVWAVAWLVSLAWQPAATIGAWLAALTVLIIWAPLIYLIELALGFDLPIVLTLLASLMLLPWLGPIVSGQQRWRGIAIGVGFAAVASIVAAAFVPSMSAERPRSLNISYFLNTTSGEARIIAGAATRALPRELAGAFTPESILPGDLTDTWATPTPVEPLAPPLLTGIAVAEENGERIVTARLQMNGAYRAIIRIPISAEPQRARVNGVQTNFADTGGDAPDFMNIACQGRSCEGAEIVLTLDAAGERTDWFVIGQFPGYSTPAVEGLRARRPDSATPIQFGDGALTLSRIHP